MRGQLTVSSGAATSEARALAAASSLTGSVQIDTSLCTYYPVGGTITFSVDGQTVTLTFDDSCDGSVRTTSNNSAKLFASGVHSLRTYGSFFVTVDGAATGTGSLSVLGPTVPLRGAYAFEVEAGGTGAVAVTLELTSEPSQLEGDFPVDYGGGNGTATYALTGSEYFLPPSTYSESSVHTFVLPAGQSDATFTVAVFWEGLATYYDAAGHPFQTTGLQFSIGRADVHIVRR